MGALLDTSSPNRRAMSLTLIGLSGTPPSSIALINDRARCTSSEHAGRGEKRRVNRLRYCMTRRFSAKHAHGIGQTGHLLLDAFRRCSALLHQGRILLRDLVKVTDGLAHLGDPRALLMRGRADLCDQI